MNKPRRKTCASHAARLPMRQFGRRTPVWQWHTSEPLAPWQSLALQKHCSKHLFAVIVVNRSTVQQWLPQLPLLAAAPEVVRPMLLAKYGGFFIGAELLVSQPLKPVRALLRAHQLVSCYHPGGEPCDVSSTTWHFSADFVAAARPNLEFWNREAARVSALLRKWCARPSKEHCEIPKGALRRRRHAYRSHDGAHCMDGAQYSNRIRHVTQEALDLASCEPSVFRNCCTQHSESLRCFSHDGMPTLFSRLFFQAVVHRIGVAPRLNVTGTVASLLVQRALTETGAQAHPPIVLPAALFGIPRVTPVASLPTLLPRAAKEDFLSERPVWQRWQEVQRRCVAHHTYGMQADSTRGMWVAGQCDGTFLCRGVVIHCGRPARRTSEAMDSSSSSAGAADVSARTLCGCDQPGLPVPLICGPSAECNGLDEKLQRHVSTPSPTPSLTPGPASVRAFSGPLSEPAPEPPRSLVRTTVRGLAKPLQVVCPQHSGCTWFVSLLCATLEQPFCLADVPACTALDLKRRVGSAMAGSTVPQPGELWYYDSVLVPSGTDYVAKTTVAAALSLRPWRTFGAAPYRILFLRDPVEQYVGAARFEPASPRLTRTAQHVILRLLVRLRV